MKHPLIQPLFDGPLDIVGDVHGEIDALQALLKRLGYDERGLHIDHSLVYVGDLTDRGPDSPSVVKLVRSFVEAGRAQCILGNHDLNILFGKEKHDNNWFFGREFRENGVVVPQVLARPFVSISESASVGRNASSRVLSSISNSPPCESPKMNWCLMTGRRATFRP